MLWDIKTKKAQLRRRLDQRRQRVQERQQRIKQLYDEIESLVKYDQLNPCSFCRDLPSGAYKLKHGCDEIWGLLIDWKTEIVTCPKCKTVMAQWE